MIPATILEMMEEASISACACLGILLFLLYYEIFENGQVQIVYSLLPREKEFINMSTIVFKWPSKDEAITHTIYAINKTIG